MNVGQRSSFYRAIERLELAGLVTASDMARDSAYPERTAYEITPEGERTARRWVEEMIAVPRNEYPDFPAALSFAPILTPDELRTHLVVRLGALDAQFVALDRSHKSALEQQLPLVTLLDDTYRRSLLAVEREWVIDTLDAIANASLTWDRASLLDTISETGD